MINPYFTATDSEIYDRRPRRFLLTGSANLKKLASIAGDKFKMGVLLYDGDETMPVGYGIWAAPLSSLWGR